MRLPSAAPTCAGGEGRQKKKQKLSKQELLQQAMEKKARLAGLEGGEGKEAGDREAWGSALLRAQGNKVLDNAKLLKRSIKKVGAGAGGLRHVAWHAQLGAVTAAAVAAAVAVRWRCGGWGGGWGWFWGGGCCLSQASPGAALQEAKLKAKKAQAWQERLSKQQEQQASKQQK